MRGTATRAFDNGVRQPLGGRASLAGLLAVGTRASLAGLSAVGGMVLVTSGVLAACGGSPPALTPSGSRGNAGIEGGAAEGGADDLLPSLDVLAARGPNDAPLMRELLRVEHAAPRSADVRADRDLCLRAVFAASGPARAWFADASGEVRGEVTSSAGAGNASGAPGAGASGTGGLGTGASGAGGLGTAPPRGPACVKMGESIHLVVTSGEQRDAGSDAMLAGLDARAGRFDARAVIFAAP